MTVSQVVMAIAVFVAGLAVTMSISAFGFAFMISRKVTALETQMGVIWPQVKFTVAMDIHSPDDHHGIDELLMKYATGTIEKAELVDLIAAIRALAQESANERERLRAQGLLRMIQIEHGV